MTAEPKTLEEQAEEAVKERGIPILPNARIPDYYFSTCVVVGRGSSKEDLGGALNDFKTNLGNFNPDIISSIIVGSYSGDSLDKDRPVISAFGYAFCEKDFPPQ